jgi:REP element-mobilizing transposase RayT
MRYTAVVVPVSQRYFAPGQLQFITSSVYCRMKLFDNPRLRGEFVEVLRQLRQEAGFLLMGWVLMPEQFHLLIKPEPAESTSGIMRELKKRSAQEIISILCENQRHAWCRKMLNGLRLPPPFTATLTIVSGSGVSTLTASIARRNALRSSTICTTIRSREAWRGHQSSGPGRATGIIISTIPPF